MDWPFSNACFRNELQKFRKMVGEAILKVNYQNANIEWNVMYYHCK